LVLYHYSVLLEHVHPDYQDDPELPSFEFFDKFTERFDETLIHEIRRKTTDPYTLFQDAMLNDDPACV
jgi:hypothetical protein